MPRPMKLRQVAFAPGATFFKPAGVAMSLLQRVTLTLEEVEALRLKDIEVLHQEECAKEMGISRATFHQMLKSAHGKLADAIVNGKAIRVEGGNFAFPGARFRCRNDGHEWSLPPGPLPCVLRSRVRRAVAEMYSRSFHRVVHGRVDMDAVTAMGMAPVAGGVEGGMVHGDLPGRMCAGGWPVDSSGAREATLV